MNKPLTLTAGALCTALMLTSPASQADLTAPANAPTPAVAAEDSSGKDLTPVQRPLADLAAPQSGLKVTAWVDHPDNTYAFGEPVVLSVKTDQDAYLTVLNVGTSGKVQVIFPNRFQKDHRVAAGQVIQIPDKKSKFSFQVQGPAGLELIKVIATQTPQPLFTDDRADPAGPYQALKALAPAVAKDLAVTLREQHGDRWAEYDKIIRVVAPAFAGQTPPPARPAAATTGAFAPSSVQPASPARPEPFDLHLRTEKLVYPLGAKVRVLATAEQDCRLTLLDVGTSGQVYVLFPNRYQPDDRIRAGETVTIPGDAAPVDYQLSGPSGVEALIGICRTDGQPVYTGSYNFQQHVYQPWGDAKSLAKDLAVVLSESSPALAHTATTFIVVER
ncbi:MAG TPA: DUF4384 domain-containing protein [Candidatus Competibacter sp.]|nr:DUF4384 domain-containing protein [Candidatus Competibacter sp.]HRX62885.1 DUF4384 domain-containing protein [Candidatus Competibacter sp.]